MPNRPPVQLVIVTKPKDLRAISAQIRRAASPKETRRKLTKGLRDGVRPAVVAGRVAALSLPAKTNGQSTGLRRQIAAAIGTQVTTGRDPGVRVRISRARMGTRAALPKLMNEGSWRHPVYGHRVWVRQTSRRGWFDDTMQRAAPPVRRSIQSVITGIEHDLASKGSQV